MLRAEAVDKFLFGIEAFAARAVMAAELAEIDVAVVIDFLEELLDEAHVLRVGGAHEVVVLDIQFRPEIPEVRAYLVDKFLRAPALLRRGLGNLVTVLVGAGEEAHILAPQLVKTGKGVADDRGIGMAEMRVGVDVINRGRDIKSLSLHSPCSLVCLRTRMRRPAFLIVQPCHPGGAFPLPDGRACARLSADPLPGGCFRGRRFRRPRPDPGSPSVLRDAGRSPCAPSPCARARDDGDASCGDVPHPRRAP